MNNRKIISIFASAIAASAFLTASIKKSSETNAALDTIDMTGITQLRQAAFVQPDSLLTNDTAKNPDLILEMIWELDGADKADIPAIEDKTIAAIQQATKEQLNSYFPDAAQTPLLAAMYYDNTRIFEALLKAGASKRYYDTDNQMSLAEIAASKPAFAKLFNETKQVVTPLNHAFNLAGKNVVFTQAGFSPCHVMMQRSGLLMPGRISVPSSTKKPISLFWAIRHHPLILKKSLSSTSRQ